MNFKSSKKLNLSASKSVGQKGFTLLEVLISIVLLVVISLAIYQATFETYKLRDVLSAESEFYGGIRLAMNVVDRDVTMLYSSKLIFPPATLRKIQGQGNLQAPGNPADLVDAKDQEAIVKGDQEKGTQYWTSVIDKTGLRLSKFVGTDTGMNFISAGNFRVYKDSRESIFAKISYSTIDERSTDPDLQGTRTLVKTSNANAFDIEQDEDSFIRKYSILPGIRSLKFSYYNRVKDEWASKWDSDSIDTKGMYPDSIKLEIEVVGPQKLYFKGIYQFKPEMPFNGIASTT